ncbi:MAG: hypothetical protein GYB64_01580 [Chloroflexi bacterium]|nr:hypothetical protein [Chloroflexota bacterium]
MPYRADIEAALHALRQQVFESGDYLKVAIELADVEFDLDNFPPEMHAMLRTHQAELRRLLDRGEPQTIEQRLEYNMESGTHSILDVERLSPTPDFGAVSPVPQADLPECAVWRSPA